MLRNRTAAGIWSRCGIRSSARCWSSTLVPIQTLGGNGRPDGSPYCSQSTAFHRGPVNAPIVPRRGIVSTAARIRLRNNSGRFVSSSQSRFGVSSMRVSSLASGLSNSGRSSSTSASEAQNTRRRSPAAFASRSHFSG